MAARSTRPELIVIAGPTASGKSALAMLVAKEFDGEIIAADSRTVYKGMDVGTAKPTKADQAKLPHWGLDLAEPGERFTAAGFQRYAKAKIAEIQGRGRLPVMVGGTGLYIDALLHNFSFGDDADHQLRKKLEKMSVGELQATINQKGYPMPVNRQNRRHLVRTIERRGRIGTKTDLPPGVLLVGLMPPDAELRKRINDRAEMIFKAGVAQETAKLLKKYGRIRLLQSAGIVYKICLGLLDGDYDGTRAIELFKTADWQYARRQKAWFRRNPDIKWFSNPQTAFKFIRGQLNKSST